MLLTVFSLLLYATEPYIPDINSINIIQTACYFQLLDAMFCLAHKKK